MKRLAVAIAVALVTGAFTLSTGRAADPAVAGNDALTQFSKASEILYTKVSASMIRVKLEHNPAAMLSDGMRKEFEEWQRQPPVDNNAPKRPIRDRLSGGRPGRPGDRDATSGPSTQPGAGFGGMRRDGMLRRFLEEKAGTATDPDTAGKYRRLLAALDAVRGVQPTEAVGVVIDNDGNAIVLGPGVHDTQKPIAVTGPDGKETTAKYVGSHMGRGLTVIKLDSSSVAPPLELADLKPESGELLMCVGGNSGAVGWITVPGRGGKRVDDRFAVYGADDHGPSYLFNADGKLAAVGMDRYGLPMAMLKENIRWIIENQRDLKPRQLGVKYSLVLQDSPARVGSPVGKQAAVVVDEVIKGSGAERAGLQKGDLLLTIDGRPLWQIGQILSDLATRTGSVPLGVVRDNKEITLEMPLDPEKVKGADQ